MSRVLLIAVTVTSFCTSEDPLISSSSLCAGPASSSDEQSLAFNDVSLLQVDLHLDSTSGGKERLGTNVSAHAASVATKSSSAGTQYHRETIVISSPEAGFGFGAIHVVPARKNFTEKRPSVLSLLQSRLGNFFGSEKSSRAGTQEQREPIVISSPEAGFSFGASHVVPARKNRTDRRPGAVSLLQARIETQANGGIFAVFMMLAVAGCIISIIWCSLPGENEFGSYDKKTTQAMTTQKMTGQGRPVSRHGSPVQPQSMPFQGGGLQAPSAFGAAGGALQHLQHVQQPSPPTFPAKNPGLPPTSGDSRPSLQSAGFSPMTSPTPVGVPPVCPSLILPNTEARFMMSLDKIMGLKTGAIDIRGTSGRTLLHATIENLPDGRRSLKLASVGCEADPRTTVHSPAQPGGAFEIAGKLGQPYGTLEISPNGSGVLKHSGQPVMIIERGDVAAMKMTAKSVDGDQLGSASTENKGDVNWKLTVKPGADAVLITTCMLSMIFLGGADSARPSGMPGMPRGPGSFHGM
jgi:hypothetical protein